MTTVAESSTVDTTARVGFRAALGAEWLKLSSLRSFRLTLLIGSGLGIAVSALLAWAVLLTWRDWPADEVAAFDPADSATIGTLVTTIFFAVLGVTAVTSEYGSRMIMLTLTATPRRGRILAAKLIVVSVSTLVASLVATVGMVLVFRLIVAGADLPGSSAGSTVRTILAASLLTWVLPFLAVCLATAIRSAAGTVAAVLGFVFVPAIVTPLLPRWWREEGQRYLVGNAADSLSYGSGTTSGPDPELYLSRPVATLVLLLWLAAFAALAYLLLERRDA
jgi:ABC-2 type transport system permease protein